MDQIDMIKGTMDYNMITVFCGEDNFVLVNLHNQVSLYFRFECM